VDDHARAVGRPEQEAWGWEMNERIKELAEQAGLTFSRPLGWWVADNADLEHFAELVRQDERERVYNTLISGDCDGSVKTYIRKILEQGANNR